MLSPLPFRRSSYDVIIVGARCAGAATAMLLARAGARVLVIDRQSYGSDTLSSHALMRPAVIQLERFGLLNDVVASGAPLISSTTFHYGAEDAVAVPIEPSGPIPGLVAPRRSVLDRILVDAARAAGAEVVHDVFAQELVRDPTGRIRGVAVRTAGGAVASPEAPLVIGADGLGSFVAKQTGARMLHRGSVSAATMYVYTANPGFNGYHWHFGERAVAGIIPTNGGEACIFAAIPTQRFDGMTQRDPAGRHAAILGEVARPLLAHITTHGCSRVRAFRGERSFVRQAHGPGWLLVGDAGLFRDPITSHGISDALRDAESAARAALTGSDSAFRGFEEERNALARPVIEATDAICAFDWTHDELKQHHKRFSLAMKAEVRTLTARAATARGEQAYREQVASDQHRSTRRELQ